MIKVLPPEEARRIAAGEVIDRPAALVREFLDNAIDSGASLVEVFIEEGGVKLTEVVDDGCGMTKDDLEICWHTHATSKIRSLDDLKSARTLGFRGEALAAAAAVSRLEILSSCDGQEAWQLSVGPSEKNAAELKRGSRTKGTSVRSFGLYDTIPARKRFLKRSGAEGASCRQIFNEKALAFPEIAFRFTQDGVLKSFLPAASSFKDRFRQIYLSEGEGAFLHQIAANGNGFSVTVVAGGPELFRKDRRLQFVFANNRRIQDYSLLQALEYGLQGWFPNASHPIGAVFVAIDPALADFNIHPAKREARFLDSGAIHHVTTSALRDFLRRANIFRNEVTLRFEAAQNQADKASVGADGGFLFEKSGKSLGDSQSSRLAMQALLEKTHDFAPLPGRADYRLDYREEYDENRASSFAAEDIPSYGTSGAGESLRFLGRLFDLFLLVEKDEQLFVIDQHAAHERVLYERFMSAPVSFQELLVPIPFDSDSSDDDSFLQEKQEELSRLGIVIKKARDHWIIEALPSSWKLSDSETVKEILSFKNAKENLVEKWAISLSCQAAVKDGDFLGEKAALALAEEVLSLSAERCPPGHCPHGRPLWFALSHKDLLRAVKRI